MFLAVLLLYTIFIHSVAIYGFDVKDHKNVGGERGFIVKTHKLYNFCLFYPISSDGHAKIRYLNNVFSFYQICTIFCAGLTSC